MFEPTSKIDLSKGFTLKDENGNEYIMGALKEGELVHFTSMFGSNQNMDITPVYIYQNGKLSLLGNLGDLLSDPALKSAFSMGMKQIEPIAQEYLTKEGIMDNAQPLSAEQKQQSINGLTTGQPPANGVVDSQGRYAATAEDLLSQKQQGQTIQETTPAGTNVSGYIPGYKGVYQGKEDYTLNKEAVNHLFKQYHNRDANADELEYWTGKKVGDLEDTLAKTEIFSGEDRDKIISEMAAQGKTYISNQAELEKLAQSGAVSEQGITDITDNSSMLFYTPQQTNQNQQAATQQGQTTANQTTQGQTSSNQNQQNQNTSQNTAQADNIQAGRDIIANADLPEEIKQLFLEVYDSYPEGSSLDTQGILDAFNEVKNNTLDPYMYELTKIAIDDFQNQFQALEQARSLEREQEAATAQQNIEGVQKGLEQTGMTFTGQAIKNLGTESAYSPTANIPAGGLINEGLVQKSNRLMASSSQLKYADALRSLARNAETTLGTAGLAQTGISGVSQLGGITGSLEEKRQELYGSALSNIINNYRAKQSYATNI